MYSGRLFFISLCFNNQTHFSTVFKKHYGMSPSEYAETKRNEK